MNPLLHFPAHLVTGDHFQAETQIIRWLQETLPHLHSGTECPVCSAIEQKNFYALTWITPTNRYTLEDIDPIFSRITLQLAPGQHHFFIVTRSELLSQACANTLLKAVEEPPAGYHFIFCAPHKNLVLPTIVSRCVETHSGISSNQSQSTHPLVTHGCSSEHDWPAIYKEIAYYSLNEHETLRLFEKLLYALTNIYKKKLLSSEAVSFSHNALESLLHFCKDILDKPLQPGSAKIIWRDFFMYKVSICSKK